MNPKHSLIFIVLATVILLICGLSFATGPLGIPVFSLLSGGLELEPIHQNVLFHLRLPRILLGLLAGATLGMSGAAFQALMRNPLAEPSLIGITSGSACAAVALIVLGGTFSTWAIPLAAFTGGLITTAIVLGGARRTGHMDTGTVLLTGIGINALAGSFLGIMTFISTDEELRSLNFWLMGSLGQTNWNQLIPAFIFMLISITGLLPSFRHLDLLALGETDASHLGLPVETLKLNLVCFASLGVGACVATTGGIGFIGLIAPHLSRLIGGAHHRFVLPASGLIGACLVLVADWLARTLMPPAEIPIGILTSLLGVPFLFWLLKDRKRGVLA